MTQIEQLIQDLCPNGVEFKTLGEVAMRNKGMNITAAQMKKIENNNGNIRIFAAGNTKVDALESDIPASSIIREPSIIVKSRGNIGFEYYDQPFTHKNEMWSYSNFKGADIKFVYYYLQNLVQLFQQKARANSVKLPQLCVADTDSFAIPLPPMAIQEKIVTILDEFSALAAELQAELQMRRKQYEYYRTQLLTPHSESNSADKSNDCNWDFKPLGEICDLVKDRISASELDEDTYVSVENLLSNKQGKIPSMSVPTIGNVINYHKDNVLIGNIRPYLRKIWLADNEGGTNGDVITLGIKGKYRDMILPRFLYHALADERFFIYDTQYSSGAKMPRGDKDKVMEYQIAIPSIKKQAELVEFLDKFDKLTTSLEEGIPAEQIRQQKRYEYYRDLLLTFDRKAE